MHHKQNNKESKTYVQGLRSFGNTLPRSVRGILKKNGYNYSEIINKWSMMVGKDLSTYSYPKSIKMAKGDLNGILIVYAPWCSHCVLSKEMWENFADLFNLDEISLHRRCLESSNLMASCRSYFANSTDSLTICRLIINAISMTLNEISLF